VRRQVWTCCRNQGGKGDSGILFLLSGELDLIMFVAQGEIYVKFDSIESAQKAVQSLNGRFFGGRSVSAAFISDAMFQAHQ